MTEETIQHRVHIALKQCDGMLEHFHRDHQMFHDGCVCGVDSDEDDCMSDFDDVLGLKFQEVQLARSMMHTWFTGDGRFKDGTLQYEASELFSYCLNYANLQSPILARTLELLIKDIDRMIPMNPGAVKIEPLCFLGIDQKLSHQQRI
ncbi:hypothetical protein MKK64_17145 [Methylobacterium sp. E-025]|uniref:hypothetical protein n=1 Tax=Methylobacterium sp. E-025 TaxID=2836561 RepID=UPI001FBC13A9|nr:hypothetical protein [Methylobacterium sp. E-025]MCJ2112911.1 hypothetical protein [Methylobacterium sp. E-025]